MDLVKSNPLQGSPWSLLNLLVLIIVAAMICGELRHRRRRRRRGENGGATRLPPGPWRLPFVGSLHHLAVMRPRGVVVHRALAELARRHDAPVMYLRLGELPVVVASSPEAAREVLKTHDAAFATRAMSVTVRESIGDKVGILFSPYGKKWRQLRGICTLELLSVKRVRSFRPIREEQVARLVDAIAAAAAAASSTAEAVNVSRQITGPMTDLALRAIMGECFRWREEFLETLAEALKKTTGFGVADMFPSSRLLRAVGSTVRDVKLLNAKLFELVECAIEQHREQIRAAHDDDDDAHGHGDKECLLNTLMRIQKEGDDLDDTLTMATVKAVILVSIYSTLAATSINFYRTCFILKKSSRLLLITVKLYYFLSSAYISRA
uniref:Cytochrome P450 n=1 Tax=Oryza glaberrima TaxID=4538 RepID=I1Q405_ORYGL